VVIDGVFDAAAAGRIIFTAATGLDVTRLAASVPPPWVYRQRAFGLLARTAAQRRVGRHG